MIIAYPSFAGFLLLMGLVFVMKGLRGIPLVLRILRRRTTRVADLAEGGTELSGKLTAEKPIETLAGIPAVAVTTTVHGTNGPNSKRGRTKGSRTKQRLGSGVRFADATGSCKVDLEYSELRGVVYESREIPAFTLQAIPWALELLPDGADFCTLTETIIPDGASVFASGRADRDGIENDAYRSGPGGWTLAGSPQEFLVVAEGSEGRLLLRAIVLPTAMTLLGAYAVWAAVQLFALFPALFG